MKRDKSLIFDDRIVYNPDKTIDEMVMGNANIHLEQLNDGCFMLIAENGKRWWHLHIFSRSGRAKVDATLYEDNTYNKLKFSPSK